MTKTIKFFMRSATSVRSSWTSLIVQFNEELKEITQSNMAYSGTETSDRVQD